MASDRLIDLAMGRLVTPETVFQNLAMNLIGNGVPLLPLGDNKPKVNAPYKPENVGVKQWFKSDDLLYSHYNKHSDSIRKVKGVNSYSVDEYLNDARDVINTGVYSESKNAFLKLYPASTYGTNYPKPHHKVGVVGIDRLTGEITTYHIKELDASLMKELGIVR